MADDDGTAEGPTADDVEADQALAARILEYGGLAWLSRFSPEAAAGALVMSALADGTALSIAAALRRRRIRNGAETAVEAALITDKDLDEFLELATADERRHELLARTLVIAQDAALQAKRRVLARALAAGVLGDDAVVDEELIFVRAIADINEPDIRLLSLMKAPKQPPGWNSHAIALADPGLATVAGALLGALDTHGLIVENAQVMMVYGEGAGFKHYYISELGQKFLERLAKTDGPGAASGEPGHSQDDHDNDGNHDDQAAGAAG